MLERQAATWVLAALLLGCLASLAGCGPNRHELYLRLPDQDKDLYARSRRFMTERQQLRFLQAPTSAQRVALIESLKIHERLARFPAHQREAILAEELVPGMDTQAAMLSWGRPEAIERRAERGVRHQCWLYRRPDEHGNFKEHKVYFVNGLLTEVVPQAPRGI